MGNKNSTRWKGVPVKDTVERRPRLDVNRLLHQGLLEPGMSGVLEDTGLNSFCSGDGRLFLWKQGLIQDISLIWSPCLYGRVRPMFLCSCGRKVRHLYNSGGAWECRTCANLNYACQQMRPQPRAEWRLKKLFKRLWGYSWLSPLETPPATKPRRMWGKTYIRFKNRYMLAALEHLLKK
jgi:hypothetical protein